MAKMQIVAQPLYRLELNETERLYLKSLLQNPLEEEESRVDRDTREMLFVALSIPGEPI